MTVSATATTVSQVICQAYENAKLIAVGQFPNSEQYARGMLRLNQLVNFLQTQGLKLWTQQDVALPLVAGQFKYRLGPGSVTGISMTKPLRVPLAYFLHPDNLKIPLTQVSWQEIISLQQTQTSGQPTNYFVDKQQFNLDITLWATPDAYAATGTVQLVLQTQVTQAVSLTDQMAFPLEWFSCLSWGLADDLASGQPEPIRLNCERKYANYRAALEGWDVEDAQTYFTPDMRGQVYNGGFV
jgi:hypothetical protein